MARPETGWLQQSDPICCLLHRDYEYMCHTSGEILFQSWVFMWRTEIHWDLLISLGDFFPVQYCVLTPPFSVNWTLGPGPFLTSSTAWNRNTLKTMHFNENKYNDDSYLRFWGLSHGRHDALNSLHDIDDYRKVVLVVPFSIEPSTTCTGAPIQCLGHVNKMHECYW